MPCPLSGVRLRAPQPGNHGTSRFRFTMPSVANADSLIEADVAAQSALSAGLRAICEVPVLAEEMTQQLQAEQWLTGETGLWCVDPIDGTSNFVNGLPYFAVSVALMRQGRPVVGVVYDPVSDEAFYA